MTETSTIITGPVICSFPVLAAPRPPAPGAEPRFSVVCVLSGKQMQEEWFKKLKARCQEVATEKFGANKLNGLRSPFRPNTERDVEPFASLEDGVFFNAWTKTRPGMVDAKVNEIMDAKEIYSGAIIRVSLTPFAYENSGNKGVSLGLNNIQLLRTDTPRFDGRRAASAEFEAVETAADVF